MENNFDPRANYDHVAPLAAVEAQDAERGGTTYDITLTYAEAMYLLGVAQLGARHPGITDKVRDGALVAAHKIARSFPAGSASRMIAMQGFDSRYDLPLNGGHDDRD